MSGMHVVFFFSSSVLPGAVHRVPRRPTPCLGSACRSLSSWRDSRRSLGGDISAARCYSLGAGLCIAYPAPPLVNAVPVDRGSADRHIVQLIACLPFHFLISQLTCVTHRLKRSFARIRPRRACNLIFDEEEGAWSGDFHRGICLNRS